jgi:hypothetical protein
MATPVATAATWLQKTTITGPIHVIIENTDGIDWWTVVLPLIGLGGVVVGVVTGWLLAAKTSRTERGAARKT